MEKPKTPKPELLKPELLKPEPSEPELLRVPCQIYSRVVGYYSPIDAWNVGKQQEFEDRKPYLFLVDPSSIDPSLTDPSLADPPAQEKKDER